MPPSLEDEPGSGRPGRPNTWRIRCSSRVASWRAFANASRALVATFAEGIGRSAAVGAIGEPDAGLRDEGTATGCSLEAISIHQPRGELNFVCDMVLGSPRAPPAVVFAHTTNNRRSTYERGQSLDALSQGGVLPRVSGFRERLRPGEARLGFVSRGRVRLRSCRIGTSETSGISENTGCFARFRGRFPKPPLSSSGSSGTSSPTRSTTRTGNTRPISRKQRFARATPVSSTV